MMETLFDMNPEHHKNEDKDISLTPLPLIRSLGDFDIDCCGVSVHPTADRIISLPECGLATPWEGRVWCNPPYSNPAPWMKKMKSHGSGVALVLASTGTQWFQEYCFTASAVLFLKKRPKFTRLDGSNFSIMRDCALVGFSEADYSALDKARLAGHINGVLVRPPTLDEQDFWGE
jgi:hypothetical protein